MVIKMTDDKCIRVTIDNWCIWIDDTTGEKVITQYFLDEQGLERDE